MNEPILMQDYDYLLPADRIAEFPLAERDRSKLLVYQKGVIKDDTFYHLPEFLPQNATLVLNNTKVIEARLFFRKETGGIIEIFCLEPFNLDAAMAMQQTQQVQWRCFIGGASKWKPGQLLKKVIQVHDEAITLTARYLAKEEDSFVIEFEWTGGIAFGDVLHEAGAIPLPPYIKRKAMESDSSRYQTVFAEHKGSVAAPTAALHFTDGVFKKLAKKNIHPRYITLHVGAGTFKPVKTEDIAEHQMHGESFSVSMDILKSLATANTIVAVGTTSLRTLESLHWLGVKLLVHGDLKKFTLDQWEAYDLADQKINYKESIVALIHHLQKNNQPQLDCRTSLLIRPGYRFHSAKALVTNFHQPRSTLLLLVAAFIGADWKKVYAHAMENDYRFLSYGDSSLLWRND